MTKADASSATMLPGTYTAEMQAEMDRLGRIVKEAVDFTRPPDDATRKLDQGIHAVWNIDLPEVAVVRHLQVPAHPSLNAAACEAVVYEPAQAGDGVIFFVHGGGWALCNLATHERFMRLLCNEARRTLIGVHYRLAPENPFPAGLHDVVSAFRTVLSDRQFLGLPEGPVVVAGDSAGANLALAAMLHEIDGRRELPAGALLFYGVYGRDFETPSYKAYYEGHILTTPIMRQFWNWYVPDPSAHANPLAVPILASNEQLGALPPLFLLAAEMDPLASDTFNLKVRLDEIGRSDAIWCEPGVIHGYLQMTAMLEAARRSTREAAEAANRFMAGQG